MNRSIIYTERWIVWTSLSFSILLQIMPWPERFYMFRPLWFLLFFIHWVVILPYKVNIGTGFLLGQIIDLLVGSTLGIRSLALSLIAYLVTVKYHIFRSLELWKQALFVVILSLLMDFVVFFAHYLIIKIQFRPEFFCNSISNGIIWPYFSLLMRKIHCNNNLK